MGKCAAGADCVVWRDGGAGRDGVHGGVLFAVLPADDIEGELADGEPGDGGGVAGVDTGADFFRGALGPDWAEMADGGGVCAWRGELPADLQGDAAGGGK